MLPDCEDDEAPQADVVCDASSVRLGWRRILQDLLLIPVVVCALTQFQHSRISAMFE